jgi:hypothetical protein
MDPLAVKNGKLTEKAADYSENLVHIYKTTSWHYFHIHHRAKMLGGDFIIDHHYHRRV